MAIEWLRPLLKWFRIRRQEASARLIAQTRRWGTLIVEHEDRLARFGFEWFRLFIERDGRKIVVVNEASDDRADLIQDFVSVIYSFSARLYGQRRSQRARAMAAMVEDDNADK